MPDIPIGHQIKAWRRHRKLTQDQLAAMIGVKKSALSRYEMGQRQVRETVIIAVAKALKITQIEVLKGPPVEGGRDPKIITRTVEIAEGLDDPDVATWVAMGEALLRKKSP